MPEPVKESDSLCSNYHCCAICGIELRHAKPHTWFCSRCYKDWLKDIKSKQPWVVYLIKLERARRYKIQAMRELGVVIVSLDEAITNG